MTNTIETAKTLHESIIAKLHNGAYEDGTYNINTMESVSFESGYQVTFYTIGMQYTEDDYEFIASMFAEFSVDGIAYVGYFDGSAEISYRIANKAEAIKLAKMFNQVAVWDWKNGECINTNGTGRWNG